MSIAFPSETTSNTKPPSPARQAANQANARKSTGPRTPAGKARAAQNAVTHGLSANTPPPFPDTNYETRLYELQKELRPNTPTQHYLVEQLTHIAWKLEQIPRIEAQLLHDLAAPGQTLHQTLAAQFQFQSTPLTHLWDHQRRLTAQYQSILRQLPQLQKQAAQAREAELRAPLDPNFAATVEAEALEAQALAAQEAQALASTQNEPNSQAFNPTNLMNPTYCPAPNQSIPSPSHAQNVQSQPNPPEKPHLPNA